MRQVTQSMSPWSSAERAGAGGVGETRACCNGATRPGSRRGVGGFAGTSEARLTDTGSSRWPLWPGTAAQPLPRPLACLGSCPFGNTALLQGLVEVVRASIAERQTPDGQNAL